MARRSYASCHRFATARDKKQARLPAFGRFRPSVSNTASELLTIAFRLSRVCSVVSWGNWQLTGAGRSVKQPRADAMQIRKAQPSDATAIAESILPTFQEGSTDAIDPDIKQADALAWRPSSRKRIERSSAAISCPNQAGAGRRVCNCGYITRPGATGRGIARAMGLASLDHAHTRGYRVMQFNSSSPRTNAPLSCGRHWVSRPWGACPAPVSIPPRASSMRS